MWILWKHFIFFITFSKKDFYSKQIQFNFWTYTFEIMVTATEIPQLPSISFLVFSVLHDTLNVHTRLPPSFSKFKTLDRAITHHRTLEDNEKKTWCVSVHSVEGNCFLKTAIYRLSSHKEYIRNIRLDVHKLSISSSVRSAIKYHCKYIGSVPF